MSPPRDPDCKSAKSSHRKAIALTKIAARLAGCSTIGTVNDVPVGLNVRVSPKNPTICIIGGAVGLGVLGYLVNQRNGDSCSGGCNHV